MPGYPVGEGGLREGEPGKPGRLQGHAAKSRRRTRDRLANQPDGFPTGDPSNGLTGRKARKGRVMDKVRDERVVVWTETGEPVEVREVFGKGEYAQVRSASGGVFTLRAGEVEPEGWEPDALEALLMGLSPRRHIPLVPATYRHGGGK